jgi:multidrug resistance efflux pump
MEEENIEIRSNEVQEVLGQSPKWILRWGITMLFLIVLVFLICSWLFKYPDIIIAPITITTENPPIQVIARSNGKISELFVSDKQSVEANQYLAYIDNPASFESFYETKKWIDSLKDISTYFEVNDSYKMFVYKDFKLGDLQSAFSGFVKEISVFGNFRNLNFHKKKINELQEQIAKYKYYLSGLEDQYNIIQKEHLLNKNQYSRDSILHHQQLIPDAEYEQTEKIFLQSRRSISEADNIKTSTQIRINELEQNILDLELDFSQQKTNIINELRTQYENLLGSYARFEHDYVLKTSVAGTVAFTKFWSSNQNVTSGELVFTVISSKPNSVIGKVRLPLQRSGKVTNGQKVIIKLENYPYKEFGVLIGTVQSISLVPSENSYVVEVELKDGLTTNYHKVLQFTQEMQGSAEIVTEDIRLIERLIQPIKYIVRRNLL